MPLSLKRFLNRLDQTGLISLSDVRELVAALPRAERPGDGEQLARLLVNRGRLTAYQAQQIYCGQLDSLVLGNYVIQDKVGQGGMGMVLKAIHQRMHRTVALKVLAPNVTDSSTALERFHREVRAAGQLSHPNIVTAYDADEAGGTHFLVMEFVDGDNLSSIVKKHGPLSVARAVDSIVQAARGLAFAHSRGIIHRDIKPANLLMDRQGNIKLLDLGLARFDEPMGGVSELTDTGMVMGTIDYMAPEQAIDTRNADIRSDIYSLGISLWYLLVGRPAYAGESAVARLVAHREHPIPSLQESRVGIPDELEAVFQKMVAKQPADRYQSMDDVVTALATSLVSPDAPPTFLPPVSEDAQFSQFLRGLDHRAATDAVPTGQLTIARKSDSRTAPEHTLVTGDVSIDTRATRWPGSTPPSDSSLNATRTLFRAVSRHWSTNPRLRSAIAIVGILAAAGLAWLGQSWFFERHNPINDDRRLAESTLSQPHTRQPGPKEADRTGSLLIANSSPLFDRVVTYGVESIRPAWPQPRTPAGTDQAAGFTLNPPALPDIESWSLSSRSASGGLEAVGYSADGNLLAALCTAENSVRIYDTLTGELRQILPVGAYHFRWSPQEPALAIVTSRSLEIWSPERPLSSIEIRSGSPPVWHPQGTKVAVLAGKFVSVLDVTSGETNRFEAHAVDVACCEWSPDGAWLVSADISGECILWNRSGSVQHRFAGHDSAVTSISWREGSDQFATGARDGMIRVWDRGGNQSWEATVGSTGITIVRWTSDGNSLLAGADDRTLRCFHSLSGPVEVLSTSFASFPKVQLELSRAGRVAFRETTGFAILQAASAQHELIHRSTGRESVQGLAWNHDASRLAVGYGLFENQLLLGPAGVNGLLELRSADGALQGVLSTEHPSPVCVTQHPATGDVISTHRDGTVRIWSSQGIPRKTINGSRGNVDDIVHSIACHHGEPVLATLAPGLPPRITDLEQNATRALVFADQNLDHQRFAESLAFDPMHAERLALGGSGGVIVVNWRTGELIRELTTNRGINILQWTDDGTLFGISRGSGSRFYAWSTDLDSVAPPEALSRTPNAASFNHVHSRIALATDYGVDLQTIGGESISIPSHQENLSVCWGAADGWLGVAQRHSLAIVEFESNQLTVLPGSSSPSGYHSVAHQPHQDLLVAARTFGIEFWNPRTQCVERTLVALPQGEALLLGATGEVLYASPRAADYCVYGVETSPGRFDVKSPREFSPTWSAAGKQMVFELPESGPNAWSRAQPLTVESIP